MQNVGLLIDETRDRLDGGTVTVVIRELAGVDSIKVEADGLLPNRKYEVLAFREGGKRQLIADLQANEKGKGTITAQFRFFRVGFSYVKVLNIF